MLYNKGMGYDRDVGGLYLLFGEFVPVGVAQPWVLLQLLYAVGAKAV